MKRREIDSGVCFIDKATGFAYKLFWIFREIISF